MAGKEYIQIFKVFKPLRYPKINIAIYTYASLEKAGGTSMGNVSTGGHGFHMRL